MHFDGIIFNAIPYKNNFRPCILVFDSKRYAPNRLFDNLRDYLNCAFRDKCGTSNAYVFDKDSVPGHTLDIPQQPNDDDCGLFLLQFIEHFFTV